MEGAAVVMVTPGWAGRGDASPVCFVIEGHVAQARPLPPPLVNTDSTASICGSGQLLQNGCRSLSVDENLLNASR